MAQTTVTRGSLYGLSGWRLGPSLRDHRSMSTAVTYAWRRDAGRSDIGAAAGAEDQHFAQ